MMQSTSNASNRINGTKNSMKESLSSSTHDKQEHSPTLIPTKAVPPISSTPTTGRALMAAAIFSIVIFHVLGILIGYNIFYMMYRTECARRIDQIRNETNYTINNILEETEKKTIDHQMNINNALAHHEQECAALKQEQLDKMVGFQQGEVECRRINFKYQECIQSNTIYNDQTQILHQQLLQNQFQIHNLTEEYNSVLTQLTNYEQHILQINHKSDQQIANMESQLQLTKIMIQDKVHEVEQLKLQLENETASTPASLHSSNKHKQRHSIDQSTYIKEMTQIQTDIRRQHHAMMLRSFGHPPYKVFLDVIVSHNTITDNNFDTIVKLELVIDTSQEMPHTIYTFLSTIQQKLYHDTTLKLTDMSLLHQHQSSKTWWTQNTYNDDSSNDTKSTLFVGGDPLTCAKKQIQSKLKRLYAESGYNVERLLYFHELPMRKSHQYTCTVGSIRYKEYGPNIELFHSIPTNEKHTKPTMCFGRIQNYDKLLEVLSRNTENISSHDIKLTILRTKLVDGFDTKISE